MLSKFKIALDRFYLCSEPIGWDVLAHSKAVRVRLWHGCIPKGFGPLALFHLRRKLGLRTPTCDQGKSRFPHGLCLCGLVKEQPRGWAGLVHASVYSPYIPGSHAHTVPMVV